MKELMIMIALIRINDAEKYMKRTGMVALRLSQCVSTDILYRWRRKKNK